MSEERNIYDEDVVAPDFFDIYTTRPLTAHSVKGLAAYVQSMMGLNRAVLVRFIEDENRLYFSSIPETLATEATP